MRIKSTEINNFGSIEFEVIECSTFNAFDGPNGSGKSTILNALNVFLGEINLFSEDDYYKRNANNPINLSG